MRQKLLPIYIKNYLILFYFIFHLSIFSQEENSSTTAYEISIPSPNAAAFTNQIETPVSLFSGKLSYAIPIHTIQENGLNIPITLNYTASGLKPNEHPSWVGSGFSLNGGGVITRKVRGLNDDLFELYTSSSSSFTPILRTGYCYSYGSPNFVEDNSFSNTINDIIYNTTTISIEEFTTDSEPDDFYFSFGPYSGKFFFDDAGLPIVVSNTENLKVEVIGLYKENYMTHHNFPQQPSLPDYPTSYSFSGFNIITSDGMIYEFGCVGGTTLKNVERSQNAMTIDTRLVNDAWYLSRITTSTGEEMASFEYLQNEWNSSELLANITNGVKTVFNSPNYEPIRQIALTRNFRYTDHYNEFMTMSLSLDGKIIHPCYLSKIITKSSEINFYTSISEELEHHPKDISFYIENSYGNYLANGQGSITNLSNYNAIKGRLLSITGSNTFDIHSTINWLQLDSINVKEKKSGKKIKSSRFYYTQNKYERLRLLKYKEDNLPPYLFEYFNLPNRYLNEAELNDYSVANWWYGTFNVDNLGFYGSSIAPYSMLLAGEDERVSSSGSGVFTPGYYYNYVPYSADVYGNNFTSPLMQQISSTTGIDMSTPEELKLRSSATYKTYRESVEEILSESSRGAYVGESTINCSINKIHTPNGGVIEFDFEPHTTAYSVYRSPVSGTTSIEDRVGYMSGIRIKSIKKYDADNPTKYSEKQFLYDTGILFYENVNFLKLYIGQNNIYTTATYESTSHVPSSTQDLGGYIGYSKVTEILTNQNNDYQGKTVHYFNNYKNHSDLYTQEELDNKEDEDLDLFQNFYSNVENPNGEYFPMVVFPLNSKNMKLGKLKCEELYDYNDKKIERTYFEYYDSDDFDDGSISIELEHIERIIGKATPSAPASLRYNEYVFSSFYDYYFHPSIVKSKTKTIYYNDSLTTSKSYNYNYHGRYPNQLELVSESFTNSLGEEFTTSYTYPLNYKSYLTENANIFKEMYSKNMVSKVITKTIAKEDKIIGGSLNTYRFGVSSKEESSDQILPYKSYKLLSKNSLPNIVYDINQNIDLSIWNEEVEFVNYDTDFNLIEYRKKDAASTTIIWGYKKTQPIAKIENATFTEVATAIASLSISYNTLAKLQLLSDNDTDRKIDTFDVSGNRIYVGDEGNLREALSALRDKLHNAQMTSLTYDPLIGVTSITNPRGETSYYEYDSIGRLIHVKDVDGNILSKSEYNYKD